MVAQPRPSDSHQAKRSLGQNFLIDPNLQRKIVEAIEPVPTDEVLEIGPGLGALTGHLVGRVDRLVLVELDDSLADRLKAEYAENSSVEVVHADFLTVSLPDVLRDVGSAKVIGNIPYNITTPIIFHLLESRPRPNSVVLMVQREVADRVLASPGSKTYGALAVGVQTLADVQRVINVGRQAFRPAPDVDSAVIRIAPHTGDVLTPAEERALRKLTRIAFGKRRKQFQRILRDALDLSPSQIEDLSARTAFDLRARPETFAPGDFVRLARALVEAKYLTAS